MGASVSSPHGKYNSCYNFEIHIILLNFYLLDVFSANSERL